MRGTVGVSFALRQFTIDAYLVVIGDALSDVRGHAVD